MGQLFEFMGNHPLLFAGLVAILVMLVMDSFKRKLLGFSEVAVNDAVRLMNQDDTLALDVRDDSDFREGHVINAVSIPLGVLEGRLKEIESYKDKPVVIYCRTGQKAAKAGAILKRQGFTSIYKLKGGMMAWLEANMPTKHK